MAVRCPDAVVVGLASLPGHGFLINSHGVATVVPSDGTAVHGVLWEISKPDEARLDHYEGVASGFYRKTNMRVQQESGKVTAALIYLAIDEQPGTPRPVYLERVVAAAHQHRILPSYVLSLTDSSA